MRDRTADLLHAMQALFQLSYSPVVLDGAHIRAPPNFCEQINSIKQRLKDKGLIFRGLRARAVPAAGDPPAGAPAAGDPAAGAPAAQARMSLYPSTPSSAFLMRGPRPSLRRRAAPAPDAGDSWADPVLGVPWRPAPRPNWPAR